MAKKSKKKSHLKLSRKTIITTIIVVVVLLAAVGAGVLAQILQRQQSNDAGIQGDANDFTIPGSENALPKAVIDSQNLASSGKTDEANKKIDDALKNNPNNDTKYELYTQRGFNYQNENKLPEAMEQYRLAESIKQDFKITRIIAQAAELMGDKPLAIEYYKKAITLIDPENPMRDADKRRLEAKIQELGG